MNARTDRAWPLPKQPWVMRMTWSKLLFAHWQVEPEKIASILPAGLTLDTRDANMAMCQDEHGTIVYQSKRTHRCEPSAEYEASYTVAGEFFEAQPGSLEHWLTARYCLYSANRSGRIFRGEIDHPPWSLAPAAYTERTNTMGNQIGLEFTGEPHILFAKTVNVRAWIVSSVT